MTYEGWANYQTWNVSLWINNIQPLYDSAFRYVQKATTPTYEGFLIHGLDLEWGDLTPDGVSWTDPTLDHEALDEMLAEMKETA